MFKTPSTIVVNTTYWTKIVSGTSSLGNSKLVTTDSSGNVTGTSLGFAGQAVKVNSGVRIEFGDVSGGLLQVKDIIIQKHKIFKIQVM